MQVRDELDAVVHVEFDDVCDADVDDHIGHELRWNLVRYVSRQQGAAAVHTDNLSVHKVQVNITVTTQRSKSYQNTSW